MKKKSIAVVGAGIAGLSAARALGERGHRVTLFEQFPVGHTQGSSHGRSRIIRRAYPDPFYTECMQEAYPLWQELEEASRRELIHEVGLFYFGEQSAPNLISTIGGLKALHVPFQVLDHHSVGKVFPALNLDAGEIGIFTPEAGWIDASAALAVTRELCESAGVELIVKHATRSDLEPFDKAIVTAGAWVRDWWPEAQVRVSLQTYGYLTAQITGPVWIEDGPDLVYGFPSDERGMKMGVHRQGPEVDPRLPDRTPDPHELELLAKFATERFGIGSPSLVDPQGCLYTSTETEDFFLSQLDEKTLLGSACSGHGFKFGPWFGRLLADVTEERQDIACYGRFLA